MSEYDPSKCSLTQSQADYIKRQVDSVFNPYTRVHWDVDVMVESISLWKNDNGLFELGKVWQTAGSFHDPPDGGVDEIDGEDPTDNFKLAVQRFMALVLLEKVINVDETIGDEERANFEVVEYIMES